jgi:hypothetical protein
MTKLILAKVGVRDATSNIRDEGGQFRHVALQRYEQKSSNASQS